MTEIKSEAASKKRKRGRPRKLSAIEEQAIGGLYPEATTHRARHNHSYAIAAHARLRKLAAAFGRDWGWVLSGRGKQAILIEIGRALGTDDETLVGNIDYICKNEMSAKAGAALARSLRLGGRPRGKSGELGGLLVRCIQTYQQSHAVNRRDRAGEMGCFGRPGCALHRPTWSPVKGSSDRQGDGRDKSCQSAQLLRYYRGPDNRPRKESGSRPVPFLKTAPIINWPVCPW
jgi:hypothetical protein